MSDREQLEEHISRLTDICLSLRHEVGKSPHDEGVQDALLEILQAFKVFVRLPIPVAYKNLTRRQRDIVPLIAQNLSNKEIATRLFVSERTVTNTIHRLRKSLGAKDRMDIVARAGMSIN